MRRSTPLCEKRRDSNSKQKIKNSVSPIFRVESHFSFVAQYVNSSSHSKLWPYSKNRSSRLISVAVRLPPSGSRHSIATRSGFWCNGSIRNIFFPAQGRFTGFFFYRVFPASAEFTLFFFLFFFLPSDPSLSGFLAFLADVDDRNTTASVLPEWSLAPLFECHYSPGQIFSAIACSLARARCAKTKITPGLKFKKINKSLCQSPSVAKRAIFLWFFLRLIRLNRKMAKTIWLRPRPDLVTALLKPIKTKPSKSKKTKHGRFQKKSISYPLNSLEKEYHWISSNGKTQNTKKKFRWKQENSFRIAFQLIVYLFNYHLRLSRTGKALNVINQDYVNLFFVWAERFD